MSLTTIIWVVLYVLAICGAFVNPVYGLFGYLLEYFQRPSLYWWGRQLPDLRWNFTIAAIAAAAYLLRRNSLDPVQRTTLVPLALLTLQAINTSIVTLWAVNYNLSLKWSTQCWKLVVTYLLFSAIVRNKRSLDLVILFQIIGAAYWGWDALDAKRTRSRLEGIGSGDTQNSNLLAAHLLTILPLSILYALMKGPRWMRGIGIVSTPLIVNLIVLCNSRGATLGFLTAGASALLLVRTGFRRYVVLGGAVAFVALFLLADPQFIERQQSIADASDNSAVSRMALWRGGLRLVADHPLGVGGRGFHILSPYYVPWLQETGGEGRSAHNMYIQLAADWGIQGLALFLALMGYTFVILHSIRRERTTADKYYFISLGIQLGLIGTLAAAFFSTRFYGESIYWLCGLTTALYSMTSEAEKREPAANPAGMAA